MPVKLRLTRRGRKGRPFYHIVAADSRAPRDGKYIEKIGTYNPMTDPATIELEFDKALTWLQNGAQPTDTCRAILSYRGVLMKKHLLDGVKKGAFDEAEAEKRFQTWMQEKETKIQAKVDRLAQEESDDIAARLKAEEEVNKKRAEEIAKKNAELAAEAQAAKAEEAAEEATEEEGETTDAPEATGEENQETEA